VAVADGDPDGLLAAQAAVAALVLAAGGWATTGIEPDDVTRVLCALVDPTPT
jgi:hypothetical protein